MILIDNFAQVIAQIKTERGISQDEIIDALKQALASACKKILKRDFNYIVTIDHNTGESHIYKQLDVVESVEDPDLEMTLEDAKKEVSSSEVGQPIQIEITPDNFGRIAALTAKQVIVQRIREAEKNSIYEEFQDKIGTILLGTIQRIEAENYLVNLGRTEAILFKREQIPEERFHVKDKIRVFIPEMQKTSRGTQIVISRSHPGFLGKLLEQEIPEIQDNIIEIKSISREPGQRAKVAVTSNNPSIGAVGTCVGHMGGRIQGIIKELNYEKIDVLEWDENPRKFISNALKPAKVSNVIVLNSDQKMAAVVVPNDQLSLAIGKRGVNVRLTVKLTGWKLDIYSEEEYEKKRDHIQDETQTSFVDRVLQDSKDLSETNDNEVAGEPTEHSNDATEEIKVSDLAKSLNMKTAELMEKASELGIEIKSNRAKLAPETVNQITHALSEG